jgi:hypothetical protein
MADLWAGFVGGALGCTSQDRKLLAPGRDEFQSTIKSLPGRLTTFLDRGGRYLTTKDLIPTATQPTDRFVLFLDLRLFSDPDMGESFYNDVAALGLRLLATETRRLLWLNPTDRESLRSELAHYGDSTSSGSRLAPETLLPRLLSLLDPSLPIVIFSSTKRTDLIGPFRSYGNIITSLQKPALQGLTRPWADLLADLGAELDRTLEHVSAIARVRDDMISFRENAKIALAPLQPASAGHLVEVFFDESEKEIPGDICVGGIVVIRELRADGSPVIGDTDVFSRLSASNSIWGWSSDMPPQFRAPPNYGPPWGFMPKGRELKFRAKEVSADFRQEDGVALLEKMLAAIKAAIGVNGQLIPFAVIANRLGLPTWMKLPAGVDPADADKLADWTLRSLIAHAIEGIFFHSRAMRGILNQNGTQVALDLATRRTPVPSLPSMVSAFGYYYNENCIRKSIQFEDGLNIAHDVIGAAGSGWPNNPTGAKIVRARAVTLSGDFGSGNRPNPLDLPKQLHYFADTVAHVALHDRSRVLGKSSSIDAFFDSGWVSDLRLDGDERPRFAALRAWHGGDRVGAFREAARLCRYTSSNGMGIDLNADVADLIDRELSGADIESLLQK